MSPMCFTIGLRHGVAKKHMPLRDFMYTIHVPWSKTLKSSTSQNTMSGFCQGIHMSGWLMVMTSPDCHTAVFIPSGRLTADG